MKHVHVQNVYSTNESLSNDTRVDDFVTLTMTLMLKIAILDLFATGVLVFYKQILSEPKDASPSKLLVYLEQKVSFFCVLGWIVWNCLLKCTRDQNIDLHKISVCSKKKRGITLCFYHFFCFA